MEQKTFALKGNIIYTKERTRFEVMEQGWLVCEEGRVRDVYSVLPEELKGIPVEDMEEPPDYPRTDGSPYPCSSVYIPQPWNGHGAVGVAGNKYISGGVQI